LDSEDPDPRYCFRRGFVESVNVTATTFLRRGDAVFAEHPVREVMLLDAGSELGSLAGSQHLARLDGLDLQCLGIWVRPHPAGLRSLLSSPGLANLRGFRIHGAGLGRAGVEDLVASPVMPRLRRLSLGAANLDASAVQALTASPLLRGLEELALSDS